MLHRRLSSFSTVEFVWERKTLERNWAQHLTHTIWATSLLFSKLSCFKRIPFTHMHARSCIVHARSHNCWCLKESRRGHWIPRRWSCPVCVLGKFSARHMPVCAPKHWAILSSYPTPHLHTSSRDRLFIVSRLALKFWFSCLNLPCSHLFLTYEI